jgi:cytochrome c oxidase subunit I
MSLGATASEVSTRHLAKAWFALALFALGASAVLAIVLVAARTPFLGLGGAFFRTALVLHVNLGVIVWFLAAAAGVWTLLRGQADVVGWGILTLASLSVAALLVAPMIGQPPPVLANYMPVLDSPVFLAGLGGFLVTVVATGILSLSGGWQAENSLHRLAARWSILAVVGAAAVFFIDQERAAVSRQVLPVTLDDQLWGSGHLLQFVHNILMMAAWTLLGQRFLAATPGLNRVIPWLLAATALVSFGGLYLSLHEDIGSQAHRQGYTDLMRWATWPAPLLLGGGLLLGAWRSTRQGGGLQAGESGLLASLALYALGCLVGTTIQGNVTTSVPAHYHGTVGAVTLAYLSVLVRHGDAYGLVNSNRGWWQRLPIIYGVGIGILVAGLAWSGFLGVPRKAPHVELLQSAPTYLIAMGLAGLGGFIALGSIIAFVGLAFADLRQGRVAARSQHGTRDVRFRALAITATVILVGGLLVEWLPAMPAVGAMKADGHVAEKRKAEIELRFSQGVVMLHAREYDHALAAFHRVIELAPQMPEAYVNTGFALLGLGKFAAARDFFDEATNLRRDQINGYYGLALALEGIGDTFGAMQAMEVYLHRAAKEDPYRRKAEAAVWEWRAKLDEAKAVPVKSKTERKGGKRSEGVS